MRAGRITPGSSRAVRSSLLVRELPPGMKGTAVITTRTTMTPVTATDIYRIERTWTVRAEDVSVLEPTADRSLTLVTCSPFYFVGSAPQRFIVRAVLTGSVATAAPARPGDRDRSL